MLKALENRTIKKPSVANLKRVAGGGSNTTVQEVLQIAKQKGWVVKDGQWKFTESHIRNTA